MWQRQVLPLGCEQRAPRLTLVGGWPCRRGGSPPSHPRMPLPAGRRQLGLGPSVHGGVLRAPQRVGRTADRQGGPSGAARTHLSQGVVLPARAHLRSGLEEKAINLKKLARGSGFLYMDYFVIKISSLVRNCIVLWQEIVFALLPSLPFICTALLEKSIKAEGRHLLSH